MDLLRLGLLSVVATSCLALYFWSQPEPLVKVVAWNLFFILLNLVQLARLLCSRWLGRTEVRRGLVVGAPHDADLRAGAAGTGTKAAFARAREERGAFAGHPSRRRTRSPPSPRTWAISW